MSRVFAPGVFDVFHIGHLNYLLAASREGDELIVAVQEDRAVERQKGGELVTPLPERIALIEQLRFVTDVVSYADIFQGPLLSALAIDVFVCGEEYGHDSRFPEQFQTLDYCAQQGIRVVRVPRTSHVSSTAVRKRLKEFWSSRAAKAEDLPAGVTTLGSFAGDQDKVKEQTAYEVSLVDQVARKHCSRSLIDLGCGDGRHLLSLAEAFERVVGVDFSEELISIAQRKLEAVSARIELHVADVAEFRSPEKFDVILLSGITPCLDDVQLERLLSNVNSFAHNRSQLLVRTSISMDKRVNLVNFFSSELGETYTAYYRTREETINALSRNDWALKESSLLYQHRPDTAVWWFEFERSEST